MYKIFIIIITIIAFAYISIELFIIKDETGSLDLFNVLIFTVLNLIPPLILLVIGLIAKKFNWNKVVNICVNIVWFVLAMLFLFFIGFGMVVAMLFWNTTPKEPKIENYQSELCKIKSQYKIPAFDHFPEILPNNIDDYYFVIENSFDGYDTHYLKFKADSGYINNELKQKCISRPITREQVDKENLLSYYTLKFGEGSQYCLLHKRIPGEQYTTGIATNNEHNVIYYFYANF